MSEATKWFSTNGLVLNNDKTQSLVFSLCNTACSNDTIKLLGFELDHKLSWEPHVLATLGKLSKAVYMLRKIKALIPKEHITPAYFALFHCHLNYGIELWGHSSSSLCLFKMQKKAVRVVSLAQPRDHCKPLFIKLGILTLYSMYIMKCLCDVKANLNSLETRGNVHNHFTRNRDTLNVPYSRLSKTCKSFHITKLHLFNSLPAEAKLVSPAKFKRVVYAWLIKKAFYSIEEFLDSDKNDMIFV
jgi:hypothetical protein